VGQRKGPVSNFLLPLLPSEIGGLLVRISTSGTRKSPQEPNLESRAAGGQQLSHALSKIHGVMHQQTQHKFCGNTTHLHFFGQNQVARTFTQLMTLRTAQTILSISLLQHLKSLRKRFFPI